jgi:NAD(P)-dependent dehydrogenase (short-subunit alcohol dehydrogenase family)
LEIFDTHLLVGRKAVITGGHSGIGLAIATKLQTAGVRTAVTDISPAPYLPEYITSYPFDTTEATEPDHLFQQLSQAFGSPVIIISNTG